MGKKKIILKKQCRGWKFPKNLKKDKIISKNALKIRENSTPIIFELILKHQKLFKNF